MPIPAFDQLIFDLQCQVAEVEKQKIAAGRAKVKEVLAEYNLTIEELFPEKCIEVVLETTRKRKNGIDKFMKCGVTYGGRSVRRLTIFSSYMVDGAIDLTAIVADGLLNPAWVRKQGKTVLAAHGIIDANGYIDTHNGGYNGI